jgi:hypothetical protein
VTGVLRALWCLAWYGIGGFSCAWNALGLEKQVVTPEDCHEYATFVQGIARARVSGIPKTAMKSKPSQACTPEIADTRICEKVRACPEDKEFCGTIMELINMIYDGPEISPDVYYGLMLGRCAPPQREAGGDTTSGRNPFPVEWVAANEFYAVAARGPLDKDACKNAGGRDISRNDFAETSNPANGAFLFLEKSTARRCAGVSYAVPVFRPFVFATGICGFADPSDIRAGKTH